MATATPASSPGLPSAQWRLAARLAQVAFGLIGAFHHPNAPPENPNSAVCDEAFGDWMGIGGPTSYVLERLGELVHMGVDFFMTALPMDERETFAADVMPAVRRLRN